MITGEIIGTEEQALLKNIIIWICFKDENGAELPFYQGDQLLVRNWHKVWPLYARLENFIGKTPEMRQKWIQINVEAQIGTIIKEVKCKDALNADFRAEIDKLKGIKFSAETVDIPIDTNCSGTDNAVVELKFDGTYVVK